MKNTKKDTMFRIVIPCLPETDNHTYLQRGKIRFMTKEARQWKEMTQILCKQEWKKEPMKGELVADVTFYLKRERDVHGSSKNLMDSMQGIIYDDDKQFTHVTFHKIMDKQNPRVEIRIEEI
jgi:Holliday junction resolvase RusA-like endonuclease